MTDQLFMEDLIARIRSLVRTDAKERPATASALDQVLARLRQQLPATTPHLAPVYRVVAAVPTHDLHGMRVEMEACVSAAERVGELNPRHPGFLNDRIQSVKKLMRRSLGWYTRPLRLFHGAVIRALQQMAAALEKQQELLTQRALQRDLDATSERVDDVEQATCQLYELTSSAIEKHTAEKQAVGAEMKILREELHRLREELIATRKQLEHALSERLSPRELHSGPEAGEMRYVAPPSKHEGQGRA